MTHLFEKIDVRSIVAGHWRTLVDDSSKRLLVADVMLFYVLPLSVPAVLLGGGTVVSAQAANVMVTAISIMAGLLFNLLMLLHGLSWRKPEHPLPRSVKRLAAQLYSNIAYAILVSLVGLVPLMVVANYEPQHRTAGRVVGSAAALYLVTHFALTLGMVLKRIHTLLQEEFGTPQQNG